MTKKKIAIIGVGLIGGSIGLSIKDTYPEYELIGVDTNIEYIHDAIALGVIDWGTLDMEQGLVEADFIIIATPVQATENIINQIINLKLKDTCIITDVGSTKYNIEKTALAFRDLGLTFIGGHPMAGSERSGVGAANRRLFENAYYVLTPQEWVAQDTIDNLTELLKSTRADIIVMPSKMHDEVVGAISHFPHLIASALVNLIKEKKNNAYYTALAAGGFRDITRIASSNVDMWRDIMISNKESILDLISEWEKHMSDIKQAIQMSDIDKIEEFFNSAKRFRDELPLRQQSLIYQIYQVDVDVPDQAGVIANISSILGKNNVNIRNMYITHNREHGEGAMRLTFNSKELQEKAFEILNKAGYKANIND